MFRIRFPSLYLTESIKFAAKSPVARRIAAKRGWETRRRKAWQEKYLERERLHKDLQRKNVQAVVKDTFGLLQKSVSQEIDNLANRVAVGEIDVNQFRKEMRKILRSSYDVAARLGKIAARGQYEELSKRDVDAVDRERYDEHKFLEGFIQDIQGKYKDLPEDKRRAVIRRRAQMYADALRGTMNNSFVAHLDKNVKYLWRLTPAEHCKDCLHESAQPPRYRHELTRVPGDGSTECRTNCKCYLEAIIEEKVSSVTQRGVRQKRVKRVVKSVA